MTDRTPSPTVAAGPAVPAVPAASTVRAAVPALSFAPLTLPAGSVTLVGAGPGDPELLTLKALRAIRAASVLLVDDLVGPEILRRARKSARIVRVGKRGGCRSTPQALIEKMMIAQARAGERVVRLKGGDPLVFGRGGEEAERLRAAGVRVEVLNGISAGFAAANALGIALTHRAHAHGVVFVTGHARSDAADDAPAGVHWPTLGAAAAHGLTLVIYMGVAQAAALQAGLLETLAPATPVAVVQHASLPSERRLACRLDALVASLRREEFGSPAIIIVGNVVQGLQALTDHRPSGLEAAA